MLIQKEISHNKVTIKGYKPGEINISGTAYHQPVVISATEINSLQNCASFADLTSEKLFDLIEADTELLILGSGESHQFINIKESQKLNGKGIAVESMGTRNACHTFQVLVHENRKVIAVLFP